MKKNAGFTLIEILIAVLVLSIGLLGMAGLQASSLKNNVIAYKHSQATLLAYDLADRIRANAQNAGILYTAMAPSAAQAQANCLNLTGCIAAQMAQNDLFEWNAAVTSVLPASNATIAVDAAGRFTITLTWDDYEDSDVTNDSSFQTSF